MQERNVGKSGLRVSAIGLGCNNFGRPVDFDGSRAVIHKALDLGITLLDCGDVYGRRGGAETILGDVLGSRRKDIVLVTKFGRQMDAEGRLKGGSRRYIMSAVEASLKRLEDRLDRPLSVSSGRSADPDRGDPASARRSRPPGQGALHRLQPHAGVAGCRFGLDLA